MTDIPGEIFKGYDIRGIYPKQLNEENIQDIVKATYTFFKNSLKKDKLQMVVGRDMRLSSPSLFEVATKTLVDLGVEVIDIGVVSTPTFYFAVYHYGYDCGFQISASHNPKEWNGMKIVLNSPKGLIKIGKATGLDEIKKMAQEGVEISVQGAVDSGQITKKENVIKEEVETAIKLTCNPKLKSFKAVADAANSMGATYLEELYKQIPGELIKMNFELNGSFPSHQPDPLQADTLIDLQKRVVEEKADLGYAPDGDGDRFFFIDEKGKIVKPSAITAIVTRELLAEHKGEKILFDIRYVLTPKRIAEENGGEGVLVRVGHAYITEKMHETGAIFGGESSAHFFFRDTGNAEGPLLVVLHVLNAMTKTGKTLSELAAEVNRSHESGEINFKVTNAKEIMDKLKELHKDGEVIEIDGVAVQYPDWRFSLRTSNTEPMLRLNVEEEIGGTGDKHLKLIELINQHAKFADSAEN